ncbi:OsmC-like protein [Amylocystis lapponica]|nr:OsmC-like protein [Amylocystis lapponica]
MEDRDGVSPSYSFRLVCYVKSNPTRGNLTHLSISTTILATSRIMLRNVTRYAAPTTARLARPKLNSFHRPARTIMTLKNHVYTAYATAQGAGRNGTVKSDDDTSLELKLASPKAMGGKGDGNNPEQLFAMGYASCFLGALQMVAGKAGKADMARDAVIRTEVHLGQANDMPGFGLQVSIQVEGVPDDDLIKAGHEACPYSRALQHGVVINVSKDTSTLGMRSDVNMKVACP